MVLMLFSATEMAMEALNASVEQRQKKEIDAISVCWKVNKLLLSTISSRDYPDYDFVRASCRDLGREITSWLGNGETAYAIASFLSLAFLTYISIVFEEIVSKRIALI